MRYAAPMSTALKTLTLSDMREHLDSVMETVVEEHAPVLVDRGEGRAPAVLISLADLGAYDETAYLLSTPSNAERLRASIAQLEAGRPDDYQVLEP